LAACYKELKISAMHFIAQASLLDVRKKIYALDIENKMATKLFDYGINKAEGEISLQKEIVSKQKLIRNGFIGGFAIVLLFAGVFLSQRNGLAKRRNGVMNCCSTFCLKKLPRN